MRAQQGTYQANAEQKLIKALWWVFMLERARNMQPGFKNAVDLFFRAVEGRVSVFIVFGSVARGLATPESDIDLCVSGEGVTERRFDFLPYRFEVHTYTLDELARLDDLVALDALLNGIVLAGGDFVFNLLRGLRVFPKAYLLYRLNRVKEFRQRTAELEGEAQVYYAAMADIALGEITSVLYRGTTISKAEERLDSSDLAAIEETLAREGEQIWLT